VHCPQCKKRAISFISWASGNRWIHYKCPHCGAALKVSRRTIKTAIISGLLCLPLIFLILRFVDSLQLENEGLDRLLGVGIIIILLCPAAFWDWKTGSYALQNPPPEKKADGSQS
jgi:hypothetical protein